MTNPMKEVMMAPSLNTATSKPVVPPLPPDLHGRNTGSGGKRREEEEKGEMEVMRNRKEKGGKGKGGKRGRMG